MSGLAAPAAITSGGGIGKRDCNKRCPLWPLSCLVCRSIVMRITLGVMKVNLLLVLLFALVFNWPIFLHFTPFSPGWNTSRRASPSRSPSCCWPRSTRCSCLYLPLSAQALLRAADPDGIRGQLRHAEIRRHLRREHGAEHRRDQHGEATSYFNASILLWFVRPVCCRRWPCCG